MVKGIRVPVTAISDLNVKLLLFHDLWRNLKEAEAERKMLQSEILDYMAQDEAKSKSLRRNGMSIKFTRVDNERLTIDEERLKKTLGADVWEKVSTRTLDKAKLEAAIAEGLVDPVVVAACSRSTPHPYVKVTESKVQPDDEEERRRTQEEGRPISRPDASGDAWRA